MDPNFRYMFYGFTAAWLVIAVYVISIALRERNLRRELERVTRMLGDREQDLKK
jgi:CcmD family protein